MNIKEFRKHLADAFVRADFERQRRRTTGAVIWTLPGHEVEGSFWEHAMRRSWGFLLSGSLALDVPRFRIWLEERYPPDQRGIMWSTVSGRVITNDPDLFLAFEEGQPPPYDHWVERLRGHLEILPKTVDELLYVWRNNDDHLKRVSNPSEEREAALRYLEMWASRGNVPLPPPRRTITGRLDPEHEAQLQALHQSLASH